MSQPDVSESAKQNQPTSALAQPECNPLHLDISLNSTETTAALQTSPAVVEALPAMLSTPTQSEAVHVAGVKPVVDESNEGDVPTAAEGSAQDPPASPLRTDESAPPPVPTAASAVQVDAQPLSAQSSRTVDIPSTTQLTSESDDSEASASRLLVDFWRQHVSRLHLPHYWLFTDSSSSSTTPLTPLPIGCTLTLTLPDSSTRTITVPPSSGHTTRKAARNAAAIRVLTSPEMLEEVKKLRAEAGPEDEVEEKKKVSEGKEWWETVERPFEVLGERAKMWMISGDMRWEFHSDELNQTFGCTLHIPVSSSSIPSYSSDKVHLSHLKAKDAAARTAFREGILAKLRDAQYERLLVQSGGYIKPKEGEEEKPIDAFALLNNDFKTTLGGTSKWLKWSHETAPRAKVPGSTTPAFSLPLFSALLTITLPAPSSDPAAVPPPLLYAVPPIFTTKEAAYAAAACAAYKDEIVPKLKAIKADWAEEAEQIRLRKEKDQKEKKEKKEKEKKENVVKAIPRPGTVRNEDLEALESPAGYLNICAQQWSGNGSPLAFEYTTVTAEQDGRPIIYHGCSVSVNINRSLTKTYTVEPSSATTNRRAAKDAAVRLALRERVLDLLQPPDFDPDSAAAVVAEKQAKRKAKAAGQPLPPAPKQPRPAPSTFGYQARPPPPPPSAYGGAGPSSAAHSSVAHLDQFCQEWLGAGFVPSYDVRQDHTGRFGAVLAIPLPPVAPHLPPREPVQYYVDFLYLNRNAAQEAVATIASQDGVVEQIQQEVPRMAAPPPPPPQRAMYGAAPAGYGSYESYDGRGAVAGPQYPSAVSGGYPYGRQQSPVGPPPYQGGSFGSAPASRGWGSSGGGGPPGGTKRGAPSPAAPPGPSYNTMEPQAKKQRVWGAAPATSYNSGAFSRGPPPPPPPPPAVASGLGGGGGSAQNGSKETVSDGGGEKGAVSALLVGVQGMLAQLGFAATVRPMYVVVEQGFSSFDASVSVPLSSDFSNARTFHTPFPSPSPAAARAAAAEAALNGGILDVLQALVRIPELRTLGSTGKTTSKQRREMKRAEERAERDLERARAATGGAQGAAVGQAEVPAAAAAALASQPAELIVRRNDGKGQSVLALEAYCLSQSLPPPFFTPSVDEDGKRRLAVVVSDLRFELPVVPESGAEDKLAGKVLQHLQSVAV